jgi:hypothetical protein
VTIEPRAPAALAHNMSAPAKTTIAYQGLAGLSRRKAERTRAAERQAVWVTLRVSLPEGLPAEAAGILRALGVAPGMDPAATLAALLEARARSLPLPDGCLVLPAAQAVREARADALVAIAVIAKSSEFVWLRDKSPRLARLARVRAVALYVPAAVAAALEEGVP